MSFLYNYFTSKLNIIDTTGLEKFIIDNKIVGTTAGVILAYSALSTVKSFVDDILFPVFYFFFVVPLFVNTKIIPMSITNTYIIPVFATDNDLHILKFVKEIVTFLFITFTTFFFIQYFFKRIAESESKVPEPETKHNDTVVVDVSKNTINDLPLNRYSFLSSHVT